MQDRETHSCCIGQVKELTLKAGLGGLDINKKGTPLGENKM
jgi:hypothetical protein